MGFGWVKHMFSISQFICVIYQWAWDTSLELNHTGFDLLLYLNCLPHELFGLDDCWFEFYRTHADMVAELVLHIPSSLSCLIALQSLWFGLIQGLQRFRLVCFTAGCTFSLLQDTIVLIWLVLQVWQYLLIWFGLFVALFLCGLAEKKLIEKMVLFCGLWTTMWCSVIAHLYTQMRLFAS